MSLFGPGRLWVSPRVRVWSLRALASLVLAALATSACKKEEEPVDVHFEGIDVSGAPRTLPSVVPPVTSGTGTPTKVAPKAPLAGGGISGCCLTLSAIAKQAKDEGTRAVNEQAAKVCYAKSKQVVDGKLSRGDALAQVRASLLHSAPPACR
jgi:hypothetical protein